MKTISLTVPMDHDALTRASDMLNGMALDCKHSAIETIDDLVSCKGESCTDQGCPHHYANDEQSNALEKINGDSEVEKSADSATGPATSTETTISDHVHVGVELDADGFPWDVRIHSSSRKKTVKEQTWKKMRGVDPALVITVEAELKAAMAIPAIIQTATIAPAPAPAQTTQPAAPAPAPAPAATVEPVKYVTTNGNFTADDLRAVNWTDEMIEALPVAEQEPAPVVTTTPMTFPEFMAVVNPAMVAGTITKEKVDQACMSQGLASTPLLSARPDLIPAVYAELFG